MNKFTIHYKGNSYPVREVHISNEIGNVLVSVMSLNDVLMDIQGCPVSDEAEYIDDQIFFYVKDGEIDLSDDEIEDIILDSI